MLPLIAKDHLEKDDLKVIHQQFTRNRSELTDRVRNTFQSLAFDNRYTLHPRQIMEMADGEVERFLAFTSSRDIQAVRTHGKKRLLDGLGERTVLALGFVLRQFCWGRLVGKNVSLQRAALEAVDLYMASYIEAYLAECETQILKDQEQMRRALSAALTRQRLELLVKDHAIKTSINGIMLTDLGGYVTYVNPAFLNMWGYSDPDEVLGKNSTEFLESEESKESIYSLANRRGGWRGEHLVQRKDGSAFQIEISASLIKDETGLPIGIMASFMDITERKRLEAEIRQAQKMEAIATLAGGIAHDFNNLLTTIQGNASLMLFEIDPTHPHYERLRTIEQQVQSASKLTGQLLGYARKGRYELTPVDLNRLVEETSETFGRAKKELTIHRELDEGLSAIVADQGQIEQVLLNLYINAADAMPAGGVLTLRTKNVTHKDFKGKLYDPGPGDYVMLAVMDTGVGMDKQTMERIFDPFFTTKEMGRGTGLGLATVYGIIKGHNGYIEVESKKRKGTTFAVYLPASAAAISEEGETAKQAIKGKETILLVDDEEVVLNVTSEILGALGYTLLAAKSGKEALEIYNLNKDEIALVILDMIMPGMGGRQTYDILKRLNPDVKVLLSSGYSIDGKAEEIINRGCDGFIQKPFDISQLSKNVRAIIDGK